MNLRETMLGTAAGYATHKKIFSADRASRTIVEEYLRPRAGESILDVGCGVGDIVHFMGDADYVGVDSNASYISRARRRSGGRGEFHHASVEDLAGLGLTGFDKVIILGVLHHLANDQVASLMATLPTLMKAGGTIVVAENAWLPEQATTARVLIALDRGRNVRDVEGYERFLEPHFGGVEHEFRHDLFRFPYTYVIMTAQNSETATDG